MKRTIIFLFFCSGIIQTASAQSDSLSFLRGHWQTRHIARGIQLRRCSFDHDLFGASQNISVLEVTLRHHNHLDVEANPSRLETTSEFGRDHDALAALNGTFFDMKNGGSVDYIRMDGDALNETRLNKNDTRALHQKAAIVVRGSSVSLEQWDGSPAWEDHLSGEDIMVTGPLLILHHQRVKMDTSAFSRLRHPRSAIARQGKKVLLITVDGRNNRAAGMSLQELASILTWLHADWAVNLDGGGSSTLWVKGIDSSGVVNYPSDNKQMKRSPDYKPGTDLDNLAADTQKWDHTGERPVANVLLVNKKK